MEKMLHCDYCGAELGVGVREYREKLSCGARECEQWVRDDYAREREEAHADLDRDMGWMRY